MLRWTREFRFPSFSCLYIYIYTRRTETGLIDPTPEIQEFTPRDRMYLFIFPQFLFYKYKIKLTHWFRFFWQESKRNKSLPQTLIFKSMGILLSQFYTIWLQRSRDFENWSRGKDFIPLFSHNLREFIIWNI